MLEADEATDDGARLLARQNYTKAVNAIMDTLDTLKRYHAWQRAKSILSLNAQDYVKYLYKYAQGVQVVHLGSELFTSADMEMQQVLANFTKTLKEAEQYGLKSIVNKDTDELYIYLDKHLIDLDEMHKDAKHFKLERVANSLDPENPIVSRFKELTGTLDDYTDGAYNLSMHRTVTEQSYDDLVNYLPKEVKDNLISKYYLDEKDLIYGQFSHAIIGDYGYGAVKIFTTYSPNIVTNIAAGFNAVYKRMHGKDLYKTLFFNYEYRLSTWINHAEQFGSPADYRAVNRILDKQHMIVCKYDVDKGVVQVPINSAKQYKEALHNKDVMLFDYFTFTRAVEVLNDNKLFKDIEHANKFTRSLYWINKNFMSALKLGQILSTGWLMRNGIDSTTKGFVQSGMDTKYIKSIFRTNQIKAKYYGTYTKVLELTEANLSDARVSALYKVLRDDPKALQDGVVWFGDKYLRTTDDVFIKHPEYLQGKTVHTMPAGFQDMMLDERLFKKILTFFNTSSSTDSPAQLNLYNNLEKNLALKVKGNKAITSNILRDAIDIFQNNPNIFDAKAILTAKYPEDIVRDLILLKKYIPKAELEKGWANKAVESFAPTKKLMDMNKDFESFIRLHTFLYQSEYTNGSISDAIAMVDKSQGNRARATKAEQALEIVLPFSSFQLYNLFFWTDTVLHNKNNVLAFTEDVLNGAWDEEEFDSEELARNMSLQYLLLSGNLVLNEHTGTSFKTGDSVHNTLQLLSNPVGTFANMLNVPMDVLSKVLKAMNENGNAEEYKELENLNREFGHTKPYADYTAKDQWELYAQMIPLIGVLYQRYTTAWDKKGNLESPDLILPLLAPSIFGRTKLDSAGTTYESRPIGVDWYQQSEEYKKTHRYVFGVSYVPAWMKKNPETYVNTYGRLLKMGYSESAAMNMMKNGWYIRYSDYALVHYTPYTGRTYYKRPYVKKTYYKYNHLPKRQKKFKGLKKSNKPIIMNNARFKVTRGNRVRRIYRLQNYSNRYTRTGISREVMINWRGANRSSRQLLRDRTHAQRMRVRTIARQVKASR
jgi:hypothetical protein